MKKDDEYHFVPEQLVCSYLEREKCSSQIVGARKKTMTAISCQKNRFETNRREKKSTKRWSKKKEDYCYLEREKSASQIIRKEKMGYLQLGAPKLYLTTLWSKQKEDDCYFKSEKLVHSYLEYKKNGSQLFVIKKPLIYSIWSRKTVSQLFVERKKCIPAIWKLKKLVHSYFKPENLFCSYLETEIHSSQTVGARKKTILLFRARKTVSQLFGSRKK